MNIISEKKVGNDFKLIELEKYVTDDNIKAIESDGVMDAENIAYLTKNRTVQCVRIEHNSGIWAMEIPAYSMIYHNIMAIGDNEEKALEGLCGLLFENSSIIGDHEYIDGITKLKLEFQERTIKAIKEAKEEE